MTSAMPRDTFFAVPTSCISAKGRTTGKVTATTSRNTATAASQVVPPKIGSRRHGQRHDPATDGLDLRRRNQAGHDARQRALDQRAAGLCVRRGLDGVRERERPAPIRDHANHVHDRVDEAPGEVAAEGSDEQFPDFPLPCLRHRHGAHEAERHQQAEQHLRYPVDRTEHWLTGCWGLDSRFAHRQPRSLVGYQALSSGSPPVLIVLQAVAQGSIGPISFALTLTPY